MITFTSMYFCLLTWLTKFFCFLLWHRWQQNELYTVFLSCISSKIMLPKKILLQQIHFQQWAGFAVFGLDVVMSGRRLHIEGSILTSSSRSLLSTAAVFREALWHHLSVYTLTLVLAVCLFDSLKEEFSKAKRSTKYIS